MLRASLIALIAFGMITLAGCGQDEVKFPDNATAGGECGPWYPGGGEADGGVDGGTEAEYAVEEGAIFPCAVWESAMLAGEETFINVGQVFLEAAHGVSDTKSIVLIISAENCSTCSTLISAMAERQGDFDGAGAFMIGMARRDLIGSPDDPDFDIDKAYEVLESEDWPVDVWHVINDAEGYVPTTYDTATPWVVIVRVSDMTVQVASNQTFSTNEDGVAEMLVYLGGPDFQ